MPAQPPHNAVATVNLGKTCAVVLVTAALTAAILAIVLALLLPSVL